MKTFLHAAGVLAAFWLLLAAPKAGLALASDPSDPAAPGARFHSGTSARDIPFRYVLGHIVLPVRVSDSLTVEMILDTGFGSSGAILLDPSIGEDLGLRYSGQIPLGGGGASDQPKANLATGVTLSLPGVTFPNENLLVVTDAGPFVGYPGRGIIGKTLFDCCVEIDYDSRLIHLHDSGSYHAPEDAVSLETTSTYGIPVIEAAVSTEGSSLFKVPRLPGMVMTSSSGWPSRHGAMGT